METAQSLWDVGRWISLPTTDQQYGFILHAPTGRQHMCMHMAIPLQAMEEKIIATKYSSTTFVNVDRGCLHQKQGPRISPGP